MCMLTIKLDLLPSCTVGFVMGQLLVCMHFLIFYVCMSTNVQWCHLTEFA